METQSTIPLNEKYTLNVQKIDKINVDDMFKGVNALRKEVIENYKETNPSGGVKTLIDGVIAQFLSYERVSPNGYKIIITHKNQSPNVNLSQFQQTNRKKLIFKRHIDVLFQHFITTQQDESYITTAELIKRMSIFKPFYYEYVKTHYDSKHSNKKEIEKVKQVLKSHGFLSPKDYITDRMEKLQEFVYTSFSKSNIESIAENNGVSAIKLWYRGEGVVDPYFQCMWEKNYIQPLQDKETPPKYITRIANRQYRIDNHISEHNHDYIYPIWNFTKNDIDVSKPKTASELEAIKRQLNQSFIEKLKRASVDCAGSNYHASNKAVLNSLVNSISL